MDPLHGSPYMTLKHFGFGMTLRTLVPAAGTACGDLVLSVPQHPVQAEAILQSSLGPAYPLVSNSWDVSLRTSCLTLGGPTKAASPPTPLTFSRGLCGHPRGTGSTA